MNVLRTLLVGAAVILILGAFARGEPADRYRFDFGAPWGPDVKPPSEIAGQYAVKYFLLDPVYTPVASGYTGVHQWSFYSPAAGFGWVDFPGLIVNDDTPVNPMFHLRATDPLYPLICDSIVINGDKPGVFRVDLKPGDYMLTVYLGDMSLGEDRSMAQVTANDDVIIADVNTAGAQVRAVSRRVHLTTSSLTLSFLGGDPRGRQITVCGLDIRPAKPDEAPPKDRVIPEQPIDIKPAAAANFELYMQLQSEQWRRTRAKVAAEGPLGPTPLTLPRSLDGTRILSNLGAFHWLPRLLDVNPDLPLDRLVDEIQAQNVDAMILEHPLLAAAFARQGIAVFGRIAGEVWPSKEAYDPQVLITAAGARSERPGFFTIHSPRTHDAFRQYARRYNKQLEMASFLDGIFIDEPRGMTCFGPYLGDYSRWSEEAFTAWCGRQGRSDWAAEGLPAPAMSETFYAFHRFRLESPVMFLQNIYRDSGLDRVPLAPGNGEVGPSHWNHHSLYPPSLARAGMMSLSWNYDHAWSAKASAEVVAAVHEFGGRGGVWTISPPDLAFGRTLATAALSARPDLFALYGKTKEHLLYESAMLARAIAPATRNCGLYRYAPASLSFPDLAQFKQTEGDRWDAQSKWLHQHNLDYRVSFTAAVPMPAIMIYAPAQPVLTAQELAELKAFVVRGGVLIYGCASDPVSPAGTSWGAMDAVFGAELLPRVLRSAELPDSKQIRRIAAEHGVAMNVEPLDAPDLSPVRTYAFTRHGDPWLLLANGSAADAASLCLPGRWRNVYNQELLDSSAVINLPPGWHAVLQGVSP